MEPATVRVKLLRDGARLPTRATDLASGFDLSACIEAPVTVGNRPVLVPTGIALEIPPGIDAQVRPRSGLARKGVLCTFGTIDADYRGELLVTLYTIAPGIEHVVEPGDRIAQLVLGVLAPAGFELAHDLSPTARGAGGHGSTGR
ncbi:dUTP diphosphatase [Tepidiforma flava]|uniref:dUTP diphosphatase n=1 Tax=Tepidiforma flava TaxID=3004094 RepID=A0ABY7M6E4_9CHLR|nr:dUTP diphosphatase [Tepidiforma flava]WBL36083.1 dUTP diphosphatase [Tepidiforma flava]